MAKKSKADLEKALKKLLASSGRHDLNKAVKSAAKAKKSAMKAAKAEKGIDIPD